MTLISGCATQQAFRAAPIEVSLPELETPQEITETTDSHLAEVDFESLINEIKTLEAAQAITKINDFLAVHPDVPGAHLNLALIYYHQGELEQSELSVTKALLLSPRNEISYNLLGSIYRHNSDFKNARIAYEKSILANEEYAPAVLNIAILFDIYLQYWKDAKDYYKQYLRLRPEASKLVELWIDDLDQRIRQYGESS